ncbi:hypothetical protein OUZ56_026076 [Daphnia magna]|uniref:Uncharacterized protein n=1 Tax=Daphnia magna TaxID=35525 RepID=A0ABQ9ZKR6_9CRUS|nr:hypothetical protein OUZ56_026076 [Daphnia magna]
MHDMAGKIEQFKVELKNLTEKSLEKQISFIHKPQEQDVIRTLMAKGRTQLTSDSGKAYSMRYDPGFLLQCLLLKMKSTSAYKHLRNRSILPHPDTIRKLLSSTPCKFGYNESALDSIKREFDRQQLSEKSRRRWGTLI